jgi:hypothetical protein
MSSAVPPQMKAFYAHCVALLAKLDEENKKAEVLRGYCASTVVLRRYRSALAWQGEFEKLCKLFGEPKEKTKPVRCSTLCCVAARCAALQHVVLCCAMLGGAVRHVARLSRGHEQNKEGPAWPRCALLAPASAA